MAFRRILSYFLIGNNQQVLLGASPMLNAAQGLEVKIYEKHSLGNLHSNSEDRREVETASGNDKKGGRGRHQKRHRAGYLGTLGAKFREEVWWP